jgi:hypothetical protein
VIKLADLGDQRVHVEARHIHARAARVLAERVHHLLHRLDLLDDRVRSAVEQVDLPAFGLQVLAAQPLSR